MKKITNLRTKGNLTEVRKAYENKPHQTLPFDKLEGFFLANPDRVLIDEAIALRDQYGVLGNSTSFCEEHEQTARRIASMLDYTIKRNLESNERLDCEEKHSYEDLSEQNSLRRELYEEVNFAKNSKTKIWKAIERSLK